MKLDLVQKIAIGVVLVSVLFSFFYKRLCRFWNLALSNEENCTNISELNDDEVCTGKWWGEGK